ncbi:glycosyltransferase, partial [Nocardia farcinica]|uniref:glycosyltransferase n=1 Tax=Nocardia farcinica TaxID=37329 RepID=UPI002458B5C7
MCIRDMCLLFPIRWEEPFGMVMIESMVCGTPVVALRGGAVPEVIVDGVTGRICDDPAELPAAIAEVQTMDPAACRAHVVEHFDADTLGRGYEQVYRRLLLSESLATTGDSVARGFGAAQLGARSRSLSVAAGGLA